MWKRRKTKRGRDWPFYLVGRFKKKFYNIDRRQFNQLVYGTIVEHKITIRFSVWLNLENKSCPMDWHSRSKIYSIKKCKFSAVVKWSACSSSSPTSSKSRLSLQLFLYNLRLKRTKIKWKRPRFAHFFKKGSQFTYWFSKDWYLSIICDLRNKSHRSYLEKIWQPNYQAHE